MSQRLAFVLLILVVFVLGGALAFAQGHALIVVGDTLNDKIVSLIVPFTAILTTVMTFLNVIDARVASGELAPGDQLALLGMSEFWVALVASIAGVLQVFGFEFISPDTQALLVSAGLLLATILLRSFSDRAPKDATLSAVRIEDAQTYPRRQ